MLKNKADSILSFIIIILCFFGFLGSIVLFSYTHENIRLEHFAFVAEIAGPIVTAVTLIWLVLERDQLQKEKNEGERRKQAAGVSTWLSKRTTGNHSQQIVVLNNNSDAPIYNIVASIVDARNKNAKGEQTPEEYRRVVDASPPGQTFFIAPTGYGAMGFHPSVEIAFSDANGRHWVRRGNGKLEDLPEEPFIYYAIEQPTTYEPIHAYKL